MTRRRLAFIVLIILLVFIVGCQVPHLAFWQKKQEEKAKNALLERGVMNILLIGIDARPGETMTRSDTMILASIDTEKKKVALLSIPRDTRMSEGDHYQKINAYNAEGGPELARQKVEQLLGVPVHYYVLTNFSGFKDIVDTLGGVTLDVDKRMYKPSEGINLQPGTQKLDGSQALAYCRFRSDALGDIGRTERQQKFLKALVNEMMQPGTITKLPKLLPEVKKYVKTDIPLTRLYALARAAQGFKEENMISQTLPGWFWTDPSNGASYWLVDEQKLPGILDKLLGGETMAVIENSPYPEMAQENRHLTTTKKNTQTVTEPETQTPTDQSGTSGDNGTVTTPDQGGIDNGNSTSPDQGVSVTPGQDNGSGNVTTPTTGDNGEVTTPSDQGEQTPNLSVNATKAVTSPQEPTNPVAPAQP